jgi:hypothetical protein
LEELFPGVPLGGLRLGREHKGIPRLTQSGKGTGQRRESFGNDEVMSWVGLEMA